MNLMSGWRTGKPCVISWMTEIVSSTGAPTIQVMW
jgi:hypothetical protein